GRTPTARASSRRFRDEFLNREAFATLLEAKVLGRAHRQWHNHDRPHSSLDDQTPAEFAQGCAVPGNPIPLNRNPETQPNSHSTWINNWCRPAQPEPCCGDGVAARDAAGRTAFPDCPRSLEADIER